MSSTTEHPFTAFVFFLKTEGDNDEYSAAFQEVSGLGPGDDNATVILKRGIIQRKSVLADWVNTTLTSNTYGPISTKNIKLALNDAAMVPVATWVFNNAWPVKCSVAGDLINGDQLAIETLTFSYNSCVKI